MLFIDSRQFSVQVSKLSMEHFNSPQILFLFSRGFIVKTVRKIRVKLILKLICRLRNSLQNNYNDLYNFY